MIRLLSAALFTLCLVAPASADPATHKFKVTSAKTLPSDCGSGSCTYACVLHVVLSRLSSDTAPDLTVSFDAVAAKDPMPGRRLAFYFQSGDRVETVDHLDGVTCKALRLSKPTVECNDDPVKCRRYIKISISPYKTPKIRAQKVELP